MKKILSAFLFFFSISFSFADIPTDENGFNLEGPSGFNYLPLALGILIAAGSTIAYFTYKNHQNAVK